MRCGHVLEVLLKLDQQGSQSTKLKRSIRVQHVSSHRYLQTLTREMEMHNLIKIQKMLTCRLRNLVVKEQTVIIVLEAPDIKRRHHVRKIIKIMMNNLLMMRNILLLIKINVGQLKVWNQEMKKFCMRRKTQKKKEAKREMFQYYIVVVIWNLHNVIMNLENQCLILPVDLINRRITILQQMERQKSLLHLQTLLT